MTNHSFPRTEVVYLHLKPGRYSRDLNVQRLTKSVDVQAEPGVVVVRAQVTVPAGFFLHAMPFVEIAIDPGDALHPEIVVGREESN